MVQSQSATIDMKAILILMVIWFYGGTVNVTVQMWFQFLSLWMKTYSVNIQMRATEQYFPVVLFIMLQGLLSVLIISCVWAIQMAAIDQ